MSLAKYSSLFYPDPLLGTAWAAAAAAAAFFALFYFARAYIYFIFSSSAAFYYWRILVWASYFGYYGDGDSNLLYLATALGLAILCIPSRSLSFLGRPDWLVAAGYDYYYKFADFPLFLESAGDGDGFESKFGLDDGPAACICFSANFSGYFSASC